MKLIAHRGNINGPNPLKENNPEYIEQAISHGFDVEIDIRYDTLDKKFYLGHDKPQYIVDWFWLSKYKDFLWIHCKNIESLFKFSSDANKFNYFWHQEDDFTLTSKNFIWTYPGKTFTTMSVIVMPEWDKNLDEIIETKAYDCYAICSDYVEYLNV